MNTQYPIKPRHIDTSMEPKGFDDLLGFDQRGILWAFFQFWQVRKNWDPFTHEEFIAFISAPGTTANSRVRCGIIWFVDERLRSILDYKEKKDGDTKVHVYAPTHYVVSTYFKWNPAKRFH